MHNFKVADFSTHFPGPMTSHLLAELGADVIKVENDKTGDGNRELPPHVNGESVMHAVLNAGTRSLAVNRRSSEWPDVVRASSRWADVVVVAGTADDLARRGLDFATISAANPMVVYCMLPAYGNRGPWSATPGHGQNMDAYAGLVTPEWDETGLPETPATWRGPGTTVSPLFAALAITNALLRREDLKKAQCIEVSVWGAALWYSWKDIVCLTNTGDAWQGLTNLGSRYAMYRTSDSREILVCPIEQKFWEAFCDLLGLADLRSRGTWNPVRMDFGKGDAYAGEREAIQEVIQGETLDHWAALLGDAGIPIAPILTLQEVLDSDHARAEGVLRTMPFSDGSDGALTIPRIPIQYLDDELDPWRDGTPAAPRLGQHSSEVRELFGLPGTADPEAASEHGDSRGDDVAP